MDERRFWQYKIVQFFHDPPGKPYASWPGTGGHRRVAADLFERFTTLPLKGYARYADWAASGADRPLVTPPRGSGSVRVTWWQSPLLTHPLTQDYRLDVRRPGEEEPDAKASIKDEVLEEEIVETEQLEESLADWGEPWQLHLGFLRLWRHFREDLVFRAAAGAVEALRGDLLWAEMPADTRCPDHSIWDHLRVRTALAFLSRKIQHADDPQAPWLLRFSIGPVQRFIEDSRTTRDLWISSFLLSDLIWHAMLPIVERYGPDCIVYPDLRGNPQADVGLRGLYSAHTDVLPEWEQNPSTFAALLPNAFLALVPRGGDDHLLRLEDLSQQAQAAMQDRWQELSGIVRDWLVEVKSAGDWQATWQRQHEAVLYSIWSAIPWLPLERIEDPTSLRGRALPAQRPDFRSRTGLPSQDLVNIRARYDRLAPWMAGDVWARYEWAREVYTLTNRDWHQMERGFDYALTHHQLNIRHTLRKPTAADPLPIGEGEPGEKCTLCGKRTALGGEVLAGGLESARRAARHFWQEPKLDPEGTGAERLCAICTMKRFLVTAGIDRDKQALTGINPTWAGPDTRLTDVLDDDSKVRVPFPSAATLAAQEYLERIVRDPDLAPYLERVNSTHQETRLPRTTFPRVLPRLVAAYRSATTVGRDFLIREAQETIFPDAIEGMLRYWAKQPNGNDKKPQLEDLLRAVNGLRYQAKKKYGTPNTRMAVIALDGDHMHRLLLGEAEAIQTRWRDVLHPVAIERVQQNAHLLAAGWLDLLEARRLMGPSLHAFISRALAYFSHRVVPWVVEQEFSGRLIYAGGDDVLCLAPANDALPIAARLQQLYSAPWVIDTDYRVDTWPWRRQDWSENYDPQTARRRFQIPRMPRDGEAIRLPISNPDDLDPHASDSQLTPLTPVDGTVLPMLGLGCSLSAGIAYGHYKTSLGVLLSQARRMLETFAKGRAGRHAVALSHFSRNGVKTEFAMHWSDSGAPTAQRVLNDVSQGFWAGTLPNQLPYKLRAKMPMVKAALERLRATRDLAGEDQESYRDRLLNGLFRDALDASRSNRLQQDAFVLWKAGIDLYIDSGPDASQRAVDGLLLCRYLASAGEEEP